MPSYRYQWKKIYTNNNFSKLLQHMFLYKFCRKYYKFSLPDRKPDSPNRLWTRDETRRAANDVNNRHKNLSCTEYCASLVYSLFLWNSRNIKEVKYWKHFIRPWGSNMLRPLKNVWSIRILVTVRSIKTRGLIQNVQYNIYYLD